MHTNGYKAVYEKKAFPIAEVKKKTFQIKD